MSTSKSLRLVNVSCYPLLHSQNAAPPEVLDGALHGGLDRAQCVDSLGGNAILCGALECLCRIHWHLHTNPNVGQHLRRHLRLCLCNAGCCNAGLFG